MKKFTKEDRKKALEKKAKNEGVICKIGSIKISADPYQFILNDDGKITYHPAIENVLDELLENKEKELMIISEEKTLLSIQKSIKEARKWLNKEVKPLFR